MVDFLKAARVMGLVCCIALGQSPVPVSRTTPGANPINLAGGNPQAQGAIAKVYGIDFSPYLNGQNPNLGTQISASQILSRMQIVAPYTNWVRSFSSTHGLENIPSIARQLGLHVAANAWISADAAQNLQEISALIAAAKAGLIDVAIVGSEAILRNDVTEAQLIAYMNQVRQAIPSNIPVTTADVWGVFLAHPNLIAASDVVYVNLYPYWEGTDISNAVCSLESEYQQVVALAGTKPVVISETGWPSAGNTVGAAVPSVENANLFALQFLTWASANNIPAFYFEAFDETWKVASEGPQGAHWGIWDTVGFLKPGMDAFFNGQTAPLNCSPLIPGPVAVKFVYVPPYGSGDWLEVRVTGVRPSDYVLATYIRVNGSWWTKPTFAQPTVAINPDGTARIAIVTGGLDAIATDIAVYMIPAGASPPSVGGGGLPSLPNAVASLQVNRTPSSISGTITNSQNNPLAGAVISDPVLGQTTSAADGKYSFFHITASGTATLTVTYPNLVFPGSPATVNIPTGNRIVNFTGMLPCINQLSGTTLFALTATASSVNVTAPAGCPWTATTATTWIHITSGASGSGNGQVNYSIDTNTSTSRTGTLTIGGQTFDVQQDGTGLRFVAITPCRVADTRNATGAYGGPNLAGGVARNFDIRGSVCNIPANAQAYSLNLTVVPLAPLGFLSVWPAGQLQPLVSTLNSSDGRVRANAAIVPAGTNGAITLYATDPTHAIIDINGYFVPVSGNSNLAFYPVTPCRIADTRNANGAFGGPFLAASVSRNFPISGNCGIPATAQAYALNMTVVPLTPLGFLATWPAGQSQPGSSTLNAPTGAVTANAAIVPAGTGGAITVLGTDGTHVIIDVNGYFAPPGTGGLQFYSAVPCRIADTRNADGPFGGPLLAASTARSFVVAASACNIPASAGAYSLNATVVPPAPLGFLTLWGAGGQPVVSTLNAGDRSVVANAALVPASSAGAVNAYANDATHLILDINGYFAQ